MSRGADRTYKKEIAHINAGTGGASLIMVFAVLCLTVFAALSLATAAAEYRTAERFADSTAAYYKADSEAVTVRNGIQNMLAEGAAPETVAAAYGAACSPGSEAAQTLISYTVPLDDGISCLAVTLRYDKARRMLTTAVWQKQDIKEWQPDENIDVADPTE